MGLIKAAVGAAGGVLADQWKEYFYCDAIDKDVLVVKGKKKQSKRSSNKHGEDNVISNGSAIQVSDGQCMMIVENGVILEMSAEPGVFTYNNEISPSIFAGNLKDGLKGAALDAFERFKFGGAAGKDQRVYYFNIKEILGNKYGTATPIPYHIIDKNIGLDMETSLKCNGEYSYKIVNPMLFYTNVCGNVSGEYTRDNIDSMMKSELLTALGQAFAILGAGGVRYSEIPLHNMEVADNLNEVMSKKWAELRGIQVVSFGINAVSIPEEDQERLKEMQRSASLDSIQKQAQFMTTAVGDSMRKAAANEAGAAMGFMGMGMANMAGGASFQGLAQMNEQALAQQQMQQQAAAATPANPNAWTCKCGAVATGKFCPECGSPKPVDGWTCACGAVNKGKFCSECGAPKPAGAKLYKCDKCGWEPEDPANPPKFCPECGDAFDDNDVK
ncbi:MAG: SPFH domain-containing protein [Firmicutes bacterium]|nr:SPFH domain-containing protein [Bacillota bacterium]